MSSVKIRLVKCPNCWNVLPESVDVPVYKCGGCGKILQAKYRQQQQQEDNEKLSEEDVEDKSSGSSKPEGQDKNDDDDELKMADGGNNGVSEIIGAEQNSHVSCEEELQLQETEEGPPPYFKRIMSGSTEYHDPCSTFSETCHSPSPTTQSIRYHYDASVSSIDNTPQDCPWFLPSSSYSSSYSSKKPLLLPVKPQPQPQPHPPHDTRRRMMMIRDRRGLFLGDDSEIGTSPYMEKTLPPRPRYQSSPEIIDEEKIKLLKIVYELEDQLLKKTCSFQPTSRSHELRHPHWNHHDSSRIIPFSADARFALPRNRQQLHSEPLPPPPYKKSIHRSMTGGSSIINSYSSLLSPWQEFRKMKIQTSNLKKKKQHLRPIARAAPFIACQNCSEFLQLPDDFLLFKGRCHRVRCGCCSIVMSFSLENSTYLVPYYQEEDDDGLDFRAPPPSEADESSSTSRGKMTYSQLQHTTGQPLHNLMGYSTVSRVFKGSEDRDINDRRLYINSSPTPSNQPTHTSSSSS